MIQYLNLLQTILDDGVEKESGRANMPNTIGISNGIIRMDLNRGFPLLTTKKMYWKGIVHELLWFLRGDTNVKYLVDNNVNIWNGDSYRWYLKYFKEYLDNDEFPDEVKELSIEDFVEVIKNNTSETLQAWFGSEINYSLGDLGKVYGYQWRNQNGVDQVKECLEGLQSNPYSRYHIIDAWNKVDFKDMALPPCHLLYQFIVRPRDLKKDKPMIDEYKNERGSPKFYLDLNMYQRSCDTFLGVPFNLASMSLLLMIFAKACNMKPGVATWIGGDTHIYVDHLDVIKEQLIRQPKALPDMKINKELSNLDDILSLTIDDFELIDYQHHPALKGELFTGLKK